jgi:hypothetical protein
LKRILLTVLGIVLVLFGTYKAYFVIMPRVFVENISGERIKLVEITLPSNRLVFDNIEPGSLHTIYYSLSQSDGAYAYRIVYKDGSEKTGECGYVTDNELLKTYRFTLRSNRVVACNGENV